MAAAVDADCHGGPDRGMQGLHAAVQEFFGQSLAAMIGVGEELGYECHRAIQLGLIQEGRGVPVVRSHHCPSATRDSLFIFGNRGGGSTGDIFKEGLRGHANFDVSAAGSRREDFEVLLIGNLRLAA